MYAALVPMIAGMVLAAGLGTRLRPLTDRCAKPLVPVGDRPMLAHVIERVRRAGVERVVVNAHHRAPDFARFVDAHPEVVLSFEPDLLGTAGGVARARELLAPGPVLLWNSDIWADLDAAVLVSTHRGDREAPEATLAVTLLSAGEGNVGLDAAGRIVRLRQERIASEASGAEFMGVHVIGERIRADLPERGCLVGDVYLPAIRRGALLRAFVFDARFLDVGSLQGYLDANLAWLTARGAPFWVGQGARIDSRVRLEETLVGDGASVEGEGALVRCVVWPGALVHAPLSDAVVPGPGAVVRA